MKTIYLHIGTPKTGTTSIQNFLQHNRELLKEKGIYFPTSGYYKGHCHLAWELFQKEKFDEKYGGWDNLLQELSQSKQSKIILSSEYFTEYRFSSYHVQLIKQKLAGYDVKIILFLRSQDTFLKSFYFELVKIGTFIDNFEKSMLITRLHWGDYFKLISNWSACFGKNNILVHKYNPNQNIENFLNILDIPSDDFEKIDIRLNQSICWNSLVALRLLNKYCFVFTPSQYRSKINNYILNNNTFLRLTRNLCFETEPSTQRILSLYSESNTKLKQKYGIYFN